VGQLQPRLLSAKIVNDVDTSVSSLSRLPQGGLLGVPMHARGARIELTPLECDAGRWNIHLARSSSGWAPRTLARVRTEMSLHVLAYNLKRVMRILGIGEMLRLLRVLADPFVPCVPSSE